MRLQHVVSSNAAVVPLEGAQVLRLTDTEIAFSRLGIVLLFLTKTQETCMKTFLKYSYLAGAVALSFAAAPAMAQDKQPILIGASLSLSGPVAYVGEAVRQGIDLQVDAINGAGGLLGRPIKMVYRDHENVPDKAVTNVREMIERDGVVAIVGESSSGTALAAGPVISAAGLPWVISVATNTTITQRPEIKTALRVSPHDGLQGPYTARTVIKNFKKIALLTDTTASGQGARDTFLKLLADAKVTAVADETYKQGEPNLTSQLARIRSAGADVIVLGGGVGSDMAQIRRNMRTMSFEVPTIASWGGETTAFIKLAGKFSEGTVIVSVDPLNKKSTPAVQAYRAAYDKKYGLAKMEYPSAVAVSYDAMGLLTTAIRQAGTVDKAKVNEALKNVNYDGVIKNYRAPWAGSNREALNMDDLHMVVIKDGKFALYQVK
jgi:branched-chain amino acid transport system substrate-binding protein